MVTPTGPGGSATGRDGGALAPPGVARLSSLARACRAAPVRLERIAALLLGSVPVTDLAALIALVFPDPEAQAELHRRTRELVARHRVREAGAQATALLGMIGERLFPVYDITLWDEDLDSDDLLAAIPFARHGLTYDDWHAFLDEHYPGHNLLRAVIQSPYGEDDGTRLPLLDELESQGVPPTLLAPLAGGGLPRDVLRDRLAGGRFAAVCDYADWVYASTGLAFLDFSDEDQLSDADWSRRNLALLTDQWPRARALMGRIDALCDWLMDDRDARFAALLRAAGLLPAPETGASSPADGAAREPAPAVPR